MRIGQEIHVLAENLPQYHFVHYKSHMTWDRTWTPRWGKKEKVGWVGDESHVFVKKKIHWCKTKCETVRCRGATACSFVAEVRGEVFAHLHAVAVKVAVMCGIDWLACQDEFFMNDHLDVKGNDEHALDFALQLSRRFSVSASFDFPCTAHTLFPERLCNRYQDLRHTLSEISTKVDVAPLSDPSRNRLQMRRRKKSERPRICVNLCILTPKTCRHYHLP
jgi:hypothetical protein